MQLSNIWMLLFLSLIKQKYNVNMIYLKCIQILIFYAWQYIIELIFYLFTTNTLCCVCPLKFNKLRFWLLLYLFLYSVRDSVVFSEAVCLSSSMQQQHMAACVALSTHVVLKAAPALSPSLSLLLTLSLHVSLCRPPTSRADDYWILLIFLSYVNLHIL